MEARGHVTIRPVTDPSELLVVGPDGTLRAGKQLSAQLRELPGSYRLLIHAPGLLLLRRDGQTAKVSTRVLMAGEIISRMTMVETINVVATTGWRGDLHVFEPSGYLRVLSFDHGALRYAQSNFPDDRLGEVLYRHGVIDRPTLDLIQSQVSPEKRFGQLVVAHGILTREQLFEYLQKQAQSIFHSALLVADGTYVFLLPDEGQAPPPATIHLPVQNLLMEGVQRIDEMAHFRERVPSNQLCPSLKPGAPKPKDLDQKAAAVLKHCDGNRNIEEIARLTGIGDFETTKTIYHLLQQGQILLRSGARIDEGAVRKLVSHFNMVMRDVFFAVATYGGVSQIRLAVSSWLAGSAYHRILGPEVEEDGSVDPATVIDRLRKGDSVQPMEDLGRALHELVAFALFSVTTMLPRDQEVALSRDVNRRLKAIRV